MTISMHLLKYPTDNSYLFLFVYLFIEKKRRKYEKWNCEFTRIGIFNFMTIENGSDEIFGVCVKISDRILTQINHHDMHINK